MNVLEAAEKLGLRVTVEGEGASRTIEHIYCCDLLSIVMGRAKENDAWITVMGNINAIAVAVLADVSCMILAEGMQLDEASRLKAEEQGVCVLQTELPVFEVAMKLAAWMQ